MIETETQASMLESLTQRINVLQNIIVGPSDIANIQKIPFSTIAMKNSIEQQIEQVHKRKFNNIIALWSRLDELSQYLEREGELSLDHSAKIECILSQEANIEQLTKQFESVEELKPYSDPFPCEIGKLESQVKPLIQINIEQDSEVEELSDERNRLVLKYNQLTQVISNQFLIWDDMLTKLESKQQ